ncbi:MAG TPA: hypothetical protein EYQ32_00055 [Gammaproteobacteria bacterium]|nr:hypothetical protein [Gammaproteobacteria bacterium]
MRPSGRAPDQLRELSFTRNYTVHAEGSVLVAFGNTKVLCTASVEEGVPRFLKGKGQGWLTAEYSMLPRSTHTRSGREATRGKQGGRTGFFRRLSWDSPSPTLVTSPSQLGTCMCHPDEDRPLTVREYARLQGFPDSWEFVGSTLKKYRMIGEAVPVQLAEVIAAAVKRFI